MKISIILWVIAALLGFVAAFITPTAFHRLAGAALGFGFAGFVVQGAGF